MCCGYPDHLDDEDYKKLIVIAILNLQVMLMMLDLTSYPLKMHIAAMISRCLINLLKKQLFLAQLQWQEVGLKLSRKLRLD